MDIILKVVEEVINRHLDISRINLRSCNYCIIVLFIHLFNFSTCILSCLVCIVVSCLVCIVVVVLCVL